ncbi:unnamed protein product [Parascedosporium putredinis]|uniref:P-loop containing nucleoside triphosphate hydrolase protein n=1 Tax=Parascedosporium putredinis TaxID=1442378 RepID=A0A9P1MAA7_9PEZI|nr:unnamed protein product [Parascedosporium putredinis]CAI7993698.1 unnamed protein product [Parascedosporium putredinis]
MATHEIPWDELPEFPLAEELLAKNPANLPKNDIRVPAGDKKTYLATQYSLIRHEGLELLRQSIAEFRAKPTMRESCDTAVYTQVIVRGYQLTRLGTFCRISFCPSRADKRIRWAASNRLTPGALVALSPVQDCFRTICRVAVVAQRLLEMVMIEAKSGFYEAVRYAMLGLQSASLLKSRFDRYLVAGEKNASTSPQYLKELRYRVNVASICNQGPMTTPASVQASEATFGGPARKPAPVHIDITAPFPENTPSVTGMDLSQLEAIRRMISSEIAIIQGPPGTGKTFVSVAVIKILLQTLEANAPIIISAHTNHALDQLLNHIRQATDVPFVRLGRRSNNEVVNNHTLFRLRRDSRKGNSGARHKIIESRRKRNAASLEALIRSVSEGSLLKTDGLLKCNLITQQHVAWRLDLSRRTPRFVPTATQWEDVQDPEARGGRASSLDDDERDLLTGQYIPITQEFEVDVAPKLRKPRLWATFDEVLAQCTDLYRVRPEYRGAIYHHLRRKYLAIRTFELQELLKACKDVDAESLKVKAESDAKLIRSLSIPIVGCTTTGLTKYRELIGKLKPRILLIEEAAETREANISSALVESLEQLILVGDHQQLAPSTDRLVNLGIDKTVLNVQRRMIPEIRCVLRAIYPKLTDHPSVLDRTLRPPHATANQSKANREEAAMVAGFVRYLVQNGTAPDKITVLTFYRGQRTWIRQRLHQDRILGNLHPTRRYNVCTVDGYQGRRTTSWCSRSCVARAGQPPGVGFVANRNRAVVACECANKCKGNNLSRNVPRPEARTSDTFASLDEWMRVYAPEPEASALRLPGAELKFFEDQDSSSEDDDEGGADGDEGRSGGSDSGIAQTEVVGGRWADREVSPGSLGREIRRLRKACWVEVGEQAQRRLIQDGTTECTTEDGPARSEEAMSERAESIVGIDEFLDRMGTNRTSEEYEHEHKHEHEPENEEEGSDSDREGEAYADGFH